MEERDNMSEADFNALKQSECLRGKKAHRPLLDCKRCCALVYGKPHNVCIPWHHSRYDYCARWSLHNELYGENLYI